MFARSLTALGWAGVFFIVAPAVLILGGSFSETSYVTFPPEGFTLEWYQRLAERADFVRSFIDSILIAVLCTVAATALGTLAALGLNQPDLRRRELLLGVVMSPLILPTVVTGVALLQFYYIIGLPISLIGLTIGHVLITAPYAVRTVGAGLVGLDPNLQEAAEGLGAGRLRVLFKVILPALAPSILVSLVFIFILSFDQVTISIFLSGPDIMPLPIRIYTYIEFAVDPMIAAVSVLLILFSYLLIALLERLVGIDKAFAPTPA